MPLQPRRLLSLCALTLALALFAASCGDEEEPSVFADGVASGDVTSAGAVLWTRVDREVELTLEVATDGGFEQVVAQEQAVAEAGADFTARIDVDGLEPGTQYYYRFVGAGDVVSPVGSFVTAPAEEAAADVVFAFSGDSEAGFRPFAILNTIRADNPDFFIYLGDTVYADYEFEGMPGAVSVDDYWQRYKINREDDALRQLLASTSTYAIWDDHEVMNDFAGEAVDAARLAAGRQAFLEYFPIRRAVEDPARLYRSFRWGRGAELFILDTRQYRSAEVECTNPDGSTVTIPGLEGDAACKEALEDPERTFLGQAQKEWLKQGLRDSKADFKFVVTSVPIGQFLLLPYDRWEGYAAERGEILDFISSEGIENVVFLSTDIHAAIVDSLETGQKEVIVGPIGTTPLEEELQQVGIDAEALEAALPNIDFAELGAFNYGLVQVFAGDPARPAGGPARVEIKIKDAAGTILYELTIPEE